MEDGQIIDSEEYTSGEKALGFKEIVLMQLQRVVGKKSQEMRPGFWIQNTPTNQASQKIRYIGDSRKELISSIETLYDLLLAKFDKDMTDKAKEIEEKIEESKENKEWGETLKIYRNLFQELCLFLNRKGWLASKEISD